MSELEAVLIDVRRLLEHPPLCPAPGVRCFFALERAPQRRLEFIEVAVVGWASRCTADELADPHVCLCVASAGRHYDLKIRTLCEVADECRNLVDYHVAFPVDDFDLEAWKKEVTENWRSGTDEELTKAVLTL